MHSDPQQFLENFFGNGNAIKWSRYAASSPTDAIRVSLEPWIVRFQQQQSPYCLPRVDATSQQTSWYVLCTDARQTRSVRETLQSFIGSTYANFNGELATLSPSDPIEQLCQQAFGQLVFRLCILDGKDRAKVILLLKTMIEFRERDNLRLLVAAKPIGRLIRDLEMAIITKNEDSANRIYNEIRGRGRLSATNIAFLRIRILAAFDRWTEIMLLPNLSDLLNVRRPKSITVQIAVAVYRHLFIKYEELNDPVGAINSFRNEGIRFEKLLRSTEGILCPDALKFAVLASVGTEPPNQDLAKSLIKNNFTDQDSAWCHSLLSQVSNSKANASKREELITCELATIRYNEGNFDEAFRLYLDQPPTYQSVCRILETALELDDISSAKKAIDYLNSANDEIRGKVLNRRVCSNQANILSGLFGLSDINKPEAIDSLTKWFQYVDDVNNYSFNLNNVLEYNLLGWITLPEFNPNEVALLLSKKRSKQSNENIRNSMPFFIKAFLIETQIDRKNKPIYTALIDLIIYDDTIGADDLTAIEHLIEASLTASPNHSEGNNDFKFAVEVTSYLWGLVSSPRNLDWVISMFDLLLSTGTQNYCNMTPLLCLILNSIRSWPRRVTPDQWSILLLLAEDLGQTELLDGILPLPTKEQTENKEKIRSALFGKSIAVYSISERIGHRFGQLAKQAFDNIKIHYLNDKSFTDRMKNLATSVDIFIINTWDAKHAATIGIKKYRGAGILLQPTSKSAHSLFSVLETEASRICHAI